MRNIPIAFLGVSLLGMVAFPPRADAVVLELNTHATWEDVVSGMIVEEDFNDGTPIPLVSGFTLTYGYIGGGTFNDIVDNTPGVATTFNFSKNLTAFGGAWDLLPNGKGVGKDLFADGLTFGASPTVSNVVADGFYGFVLTGGQRFNAREITGAGQPNGTQKNLFVRERGGSAVPISAALIRLPVPAQEP